jgi:hypothetical protein
MSGSNSSIPGAAPRAELSGAAALAPLHLTVHNAAVPELQQRTRLGRLKMLLVLLVCAAPVVASYFTYFVIRPQGRSNYAELIEPQRPLPESLPLHALDGSAVSAAQLKGQWLLVVVGSGDCDAACDRRLFLQRQLREMLGKERDRVDKLWLVTDDAPLRPALLEALRHPSPTQVLRVPREALSQWLAPSAGHTLQQQLYIVDPLGHWMMRAPADPDPAKLKRDLEKLLRASASWDRPGR